MVEQGRADSRLKILLSFDFLKDGLELFLAVDITIIIFKQFLQACVKLFYFFNHNINSQNEATGIFKGKVF